MTQQTFTSPGVVVATAVAVIALGALIVAIAQVVLMRRHNRLSVMPFLTFYVSYGTKEMPFGVHVANNGIGPAVIKQLTVYLDGKTFTPERGHSWNAAWFEAGFKGSFVAFHFPEGRSALRAGERFPLLTIDEGYESDALSYQFYQALKRIDLEIVFESIYRDARGVRLHGAMSDYVPKKPAKG
jgi:hypothetical protein